MQPILRDFPDAFTTERLLIRSPRPGDGPALYEAITESSDRLRPWFPWANREFTREDSEANIRRSCVAFLERTDLRLLVFERATGAFVASSGLHRINWDVPKFEIGYWIRTRYEGRGYMTEAVQGIAAFALDTLDAQRVEIRCDPANVRSSAVARRCGFTLEARLRNDSRDVQNNLRDTLVYVRLPESA